MKLKEFYKEHKTTIIVVLILVGAYLVFNDGLQGASYNLMDSREMYMGDVMPSYSKTAGSAMPMEMYDDGYVDYEEAAYYPEEDRKIMKTANAQLEVDKKSYDSAKLSLEGLVSKHNGYYTSKNERKTTYGDSDYRTFTMTFKVPVEVFEAAISDLRNVAEVESLNINANDMTTQYMDTLAYLDNYKLEKKKLEELYNRASKIEDLIMVQERITQVQRMIDSYEQQLKNIDRTTDYSTVYVTLSEKRDIIESYYGMTGLRELWRNVLESFDSVFVLISSVLGWAIVIGVGYAGYKGVNKLRKKKKN